MMIHALLLLIHHIFCCRSHILVLICGLWIIFLGGLLDLNNVSALISKKVWLYIFLFFTLLGCGQPLNLHWHELWKQEKCSSLGPSRGIFYKTQWALQGIKLTRLMSIFTSKKSLEIFDKNQLTKSDLKRTVESALPHAN